MNRGTRAACDRCHGQKMKCLREPGQTKCNRCLPSQSECVFSQSKKAGRPLAGRALNLAPTSPTSRRKTDFGASANKSHLVPSCDGVSMSSADSVEFSMPTPTDAATMSPNSDTFLDLPFLPSQTYTHEAGAFGTDEAFLAGHKDFWQDSLDEFMQVPLVPQLRPASSTNQSSHHQPTNFEPRKTAIGNFENQTAFTAVYQLSALSASLYASVDLYTKNAEKAVHTASSEELGKMATDVIQSSITFLSILCSFVDVVSADRSNTPDTPTTLQILTAYIRLTQLHHGLYTQIRDFLSSSNNLSSNSTSCHMSVRSATAPGSQSASEPMLPAVFPDLALGGFSLASFARFQFKFLVQVCVHELGMIEATLGLPAGCRVSDVENTSGLMRPLLGAGDEKTRLLVWTILREIEQPAHGIRDTLNELREALRGSIQI